MCSSVRQILAKKGWAWPRPRGSSTGSLRGGRERYHCTACWVVVERKRRGLLIRSSQLAGAERTGRGGVGDRGAAAEEWSSLASSGSRSCSEKPARGRRDRGDLIPEPSAAGSLTSTSSTSINQEFLEHLAGVRGRRRTPENSPERGGRN